jgi:hypothetical protein
MVNQLHTIKDRLVKAEKADAKLPRVTAKGGLAAAQALARRQELRNIVKACFSGPQGRHAGLSDGSLREFAGVRFVVGREGIQRDGADARGRSAAAHAGAGRRAFCGND